MALLAVAAVVDASTDHHHQHHAATSSSQSETGSGGDESSVAEATAALLNQRKWLQVLVDFALNIDENRHASQADYVDSFSYHECHSPRALAFLYAVLSSASMVDYFLAGVMSSAARAQISPFLLDYIQNRLVGNHDDDNVSSSSSSSSLSSSSAGVAALGLFVRTRIQLKRSFDSAENARLNRLIRRLYSSYLTSSAEMQQHQQTITQGQRVLANCTTRVLVECLDALYDEESCHYDESHVLDEFVEHLCSRLENDDEAKQDEEEEAEEDEGKQIATASLVNLACVAFRANRVGNELLVRVFTLLSGEKRPKLQKQTSEPLLAVFLRTLISLGHLDSIRWLEQTYAQQWARSLNDFKLNVENDVRKVERAVESLLAFVGGVSLRSVLNRQPASLPPELERTLVKSELKLKDILKLYARHSQTSSSHDPTSSASRQVTNRRHICMSLAFMHFKYQQVSYEEVYTSKTNKILNHIFFCKAKLSIKSEYQVSTKSWENANIRWISIKILRKKMSTLISKKC